MSVTVHPFGENSIAIDYNVNHKESTFLEIFQAMHDFVTTKGQVSLDTDFYDKQEGAVPQKHRRCYRSLNKDGVTYKYVMPHLQDRATYRCIAMAVPEAYDVSAKTLTNTAAQSDVQTTNQRMEMTANYFGRLYVFATERHFVIYNQGNLSGSDVTTGNGASGVVEVIPVMPNDPTPNHFYFASTYFVAGHTYFPRTIATVSSSAVSQLFTPMGSIGAGGALAANVIPNRARQIGDRPEEFVYDVIVTCDPLGSQYPKGKVCSLKLVTTDSSGFASAGSGMGNIVKIKVNEDNFVDPEGVEKEHILFSHNGRGTVALPM